MKRLGVIVAALLVSTACATTQEAETQGADRTVVIQMRDNHFEPDKIEVARGETIAFRFTNVGRARHDAFIGDADAQERHEREARMNDDEPHGAEHAGDEPNAITLEPGDTGNLTYRFSERGEILIGCHEPDHYDGGMVATVHVE